MKTKKIKRLEEENEDLKKEVHDLHFEKMLLNIRYQREFSYLTHRLLNIESNPMISLPSGNILFYKELNEEQLEYLESLANKKQK